eukprot:10378557-Lingulodinium_polyedra.AAC.1
MAAALAAALQLAGRPDAAAIVLAVFRCLLRTAEAVRPTRGQLVPAADFSSCAVALPVTKTSRGKLAAEA